MTDYQVGDTVKVSFEGVVRHTGLGSTVCVEAPGMAYRSTFIPTDSVIEVLERGVYTDPVGTIRQPHDNDALYIATAPPGCVGRWLKLGSHQSLGDESVIELDTFVLDRIVAREVDA